MDPVSAGHPELVPFLDRAGRFTQWPVKRKLQLTALHWMAALFEPGVVYRERDINNILDDWARFGDSARLRRDLCDLRLLERHSDGSAYWRAADAAPKPVIEFL